MEPTTELLEKYLEGKADPSESILVEEWLKQNKLSAPELKQMLYMPEGVKLMLSLNVQEDWLKVKEAFPKQKQRFINNYWLRVAAVITFLVSVCLVFYLTNQSDNNVLTVINETNKVKKISLPDGSAVFLNMRASVSYNEDFNDGRNLIMKGEAFYEIQRNPSQPFTIQAQNCIVRVLGTSFNIKADSAAIEVSVATGKVSFNAEKQEAVYLEKGEKGLYLAKNGKTIKQQNDLNYLSWKTGILQFENTSLDKVITDLEKHFNVEITLISSAQQLPTYTSRFEWASLEEILEEMQLILSIQYTINSKNVSITIDK
jgi:transmembrane sensor